jgi:uncharacterized protein (TIGR02118 family)
MIKAVYHVTYNDDLTVEEAREHHVDVHGPLGARIPGMRSYTLSYPLDADAVDFSVLVETTWDDVASFEAAMASPEAEPALEDIPTLTDPDTMEMFVCKEVTILAPQGDAAAHASTDDRVDA